MTLVCYHEEQDALRFYDCAQECWEDMIYVFVFTPKEQRTSLTQLMAWGWEVIGEL
jgi:hypothetical protein